MANRGYQKEPGFVAETVSSDVEYIVVDTDKGGGSLLGGPLYEAWDDALTAYNKMVAEIYPNGDPHGAVVIMMVNLVHSGEYRGEEA